MSSSFIFVDMSKRILWILTIALSLSLTALVITSASFLINTLFVKIKELFATPASLPP
jgi:hypothetical protein